MRPSPRIRRLNADYRSICQLRDESSIFSFECTGSPAQKYELVFKGAGFYRNPSSGRIDVRDRHHVSVELGAAYPRMMPGLAWKSPIYHPNISNNGVVCLGGYGTHWVPSLTLSEMVTMLWDMIRYANYDSDSPYNRDAALWAKIQQDFKLPIDTRSIRDRLSGEENENQIEVATLVESPKKKKPSKWGILARLVSSEPPLPTQPIEMVDVDQSEPALDADVEIDLDSTDNGIHIINAQVAPLAVDPEEVENTGIVFLD